MSFYFNAKLLPQHKAASVVQFAAAILAGEASAKQSSADAKKVVDKAIEMAAYLHDIADGTATVGEEPKAQEVVAEQEKSLRE